MGIAYRLRQLQANLTAAPPTGDDAAAVAAVLSPAEQALFDRYSPADKAHSLRVLRTLQAAGHTDPDLAAAALLHDIGKTRYPLTVLDRTIIVIGSALMPRRAAEWGRGPLNRWRRPFIIRAQHAAWGADMAAAAASRPAVIDLIRRHQNPPTTAAADARLRLLQWADDQN